jgi:pyridoxamine 5'-phosphate oxidase
MVDYKALRKEYRRGELLDSSLEKNPFRLFNRWFEQALHSNIEEVNAMTLATSTQDGKPSARIVLLKGFNEKGFTFYTNYSSRKGEELIANPQASLLFYWKELDRQVRIEGLAHKISGKESDAYFNSRTLESRISAVVSPQSQVIPSRRFLEDKWVEYLKKVEKEGVKRSPDWGGFRLIPHSIEFWQGRSNRLHDRIRYFKKDDGWVISRLAP